MTVASSSDIWAEGSPYERYVGRWSRLMAEQFLLWLAGAPAQTWVDVGCGTGALASAILASAQPRQVFAVEPSKGFLALARDSLEGRATLLLGDAAHIPLPDASVEFAVSGLVLNFVPDVEDALAEMRRIVKRGGTVGAYVWDYAEGMEMMRHFWDVATSFDQRARSLDEGLCFPLCRQDALADAFMRAQLLDVRVVPLVIATRFQDFDDYWTPFLGGQGPAPAYACSLNEASRDRLREGLRQRLPIAPDGSITLQARAWAVRGVQGPPGG